jgi:hypothetical protein
VAERLPFLFSFKQSLDDLERMLLEEFRGQSLQMIQIYRNHHIGKPFIKRNYKKILGEMEQKGLIKAKPNLAERKPKGTFADNVLVTFPNK